MLAPEKEEVLTSLLWLSYRPSCSLALFSLWEMSLTHLSGFTHLRGHAPGGGWARISVLDRRGGLHSITLSHALFFRTVCSVSTSSFLPSVQRDSVTATLTGPLVSHPHVPTLDKPWHISFQEEETLSCDEECPHVTPVVCSPSLGLQSSLEGVGGRFHKC